MSHQVMVLEGLAGWVGSRRRKAVPCVPHGTSWLLVLESSHTLCLLRCLPHAPPIYLPL